MEWISTKDKLPEIGQQTLIYVYDWRCNLFVSTFCECKVLGNDVVPYRWEGPGKFSFGAQLVTHWMPVPEPPTVEAGV